MAIEISETAGVRNLHFGSNWVQGAMRIARPWALELDYTREMMASLLLREDSAWPRRVLLVGLGAASLTKFLYRHRPQAKLTVVEIDPAVVSTAYQYFRLPEDPKRIHIVIGDGADYMTLEKPPVDLILVDGFDAEARSGRLDKLPFYLDCKARLSDDGLLVANLLSGRRTYRRSVDSLAEAFEQRTLVFPSCDAGNVIVAAAAGQPVSLTVPELKTSALALKKETGLNLLPTLVRLEQAKAFREGRLEL